MNEFAFLLLEWYDRFSRTLPWRGETDPYRIWLSEIMLQQTRAETVLSYYNRFLNAFPTVAALANAETDDVLKLWEGLGYYSRARNLHAAAKRVHEEMNDRFPADAKSLRALPGVGPYAANAIASIAYGECVPALDGNQARVLSRICAHSEPIKTPFDLESEALLRIDRNRPGDYNQALMDLGSGICTPRAPKCDCCPVSECCLAHLEGDPESYPRKRPPIAKREEDWLILIVKIGNTVCVRRRDEKGLLGGLYEFPAIQNARSEREALAHLRESGFKNPSVIRHLPASKHVFTHLIWHTQGFLISADAAGAGFAQVSTLDNLAFPTALRVYREIAEEILAE